MTEAGGAPRLSDSQRLAWLRLIRSDNVGPATFRSLINRFGSAQTALDNLPDLAKRGGKRAIQIASIDEAERELNAARKLDIRIIAIGEADYPKMLRHLENPPPLVSIKGDQAIFDRPAIAIVGARNASLAGIKMARLLADELSAKGYAIISGLARGIDRAAHEGSLSAGTVGIFAGGLERPYPPENIALVADMTSGPGAILSEMPLFWSPRAIDFPRRNRLIAGLSYGLVVVEAAKRSGSLISARMAGEMGRLVFAVPGSPFDSRSAGSNQLLKDGAILVTELEDITCQIEPLLGLPPQMREPDIGLEPEPYLMEDAPEDARAKLLECMSSVPMHIDAYVEHTGIRPAQIHLILLELDLAGRLERHSGGLVSLLGDAL